MWKVLARIYKPTTVTRSSLKLSVLNDLVFKTVSYDLMTKKINGSLENLVDNVAAL